MTSTLAPFVKACPPVRRAMDETTFHLSMLREMLRLVGWQFKQLGTQWTAERQRGVGFHARVVPLNYVGEEHDVLLRAALDTMGEQVRT